MSKREMTFELLKDSYSYFFKNGHFDNRMAHQYLGELSNKNIRVRYICNIYNMFLFNNNLIGTESQLYISSGLSGRKVAEYRCNKLGIEADETNITKYRNKILYENRKYTSLFTIQVNNFRSDNIIRILMTYPEISDDLWKKINNTIVTILGEDTLSYLNNRFIIHFPKVKFQGKVNDKKLDELIDIIKPYSSTVKKEFETKLKDYEDEIAYLSYILNPDSVLDKQDKERREALNDLFNEEKVKEFISAKHPAIEEEEGEVEEIREVIITQQNQEAIIDKIADIESEADKLNSEISKMLLVSLIRYNDISKEDQKAASNVLNNGVKDILKKVKNSSFGGAKNYLSYLTGEVEASSFVDNGSGL
jgi:hypothetical protein